MADPTPERRRELLEELTAEAIEAGTCDEPAPQVTRPPMPAWSERIAAGGRADR